MKVGGKEVPVVDVDEDAGENGDAVLAVEVEVGPKSEIEVG